MVWVGISAQGKTDLHVIDIGTLTTERYVNEILDVHVRPCAGAIGPDFILMDDNARAHRTRITNRYLKQAAIVRLDWPARSPDLNPIEHAWDVLQKAISSRQVQPATVRELREALIEEWAQLPQHKLRRLIGSMRRRYQAVINAHGHHTRYYEAKTHRLVIFLIFRFPPAILKMLIFDPHVPSAIFTHQWTFTWPLLY